VQRDTVVGDIEVSKGVVGMAGEKTSMGLEQNVAGLLCYVVGWITGLIFFLVEKDNKFVRFHAMQSIIVFGGLSVIGIILGMIPILGWIAGALLWLLAVILWILLMVKAYQNTWYKLPWVGDLAEKYSK
jgi:uncharacterized membrane protein